MSEVTIRAASDVDLEAINRVIDAAIMTWDLPERVKRLSLPSYHYTAIDLAHYAIHVAVLDDRIVGVVAWDKEPHTVQQQRCLLLHGIYVHPDHHHQGIGSRLFSLAEQAGREQGLTGLVVKSQKDAEAFYASRGMHKLAVTDSEREFASRFWKTFKAIGDCLQPRL